MNTDISIVLYRPTIDEVKRVLAHWETLRDEYRLIWMLVSGGAANMSEIAENGPNLRLTRRADNLGFASGHNLLMNMAFEGGADEVLIVNPDVLIRPGSLSAFVKLTRSFVAPAVFGPWLERLSPEMAWTGDADSLGIRWDAWARHFDIGQGDPLPVTDGSYHPEEGISGACLLVRQEIHQTAVATWGYFFDDIFLAYREDAELGVRLRSAQIGSVAVALSGFGHVRTVRGSARGNQLQDLLGVRNRFVIRGILGRTRPGWLMLPTVRDAIVAIAALTTERSSLDGLRSALRIRRTLRRRLGR